MKVGTDGVLLGAWASLEYAPNSILDIGAGSGVISLQLAQRSSAELIDAVEIDPEAFEQCVENFENSLWGDRLFCYHASLQEFAEEMEKYDLIVSNPPFYTPSQHKGKESPSTERQKARYTRTLSFEDLIVGGTQLLHPQGIFALILPKTAAAEFVAFAKNHHLYLQKRLDVRGTPESPIKRSLLQFGFDEKPLQSELLTIEVERHNYTEAYRKLVHPFYLKL